MNTILYPCPCHAEKFKAFCPSSVGILCPLYPLPYANRMQHYAKKRKVANASKSKPKVKASKPTEIHIPAHDGNDDDQLSNHDLELLDEYAGATTFLENLDHKGIARCVASLMYLPPSLSA